MKHRKKEKVKDKNEEMWRFYFEDLNPYGPHGPFVFFSSFQFVFFIKLLTSYI